jgi:hypothetical protein
LTQKLTQDSIMLVSLKERLHSLQNALDIKTADLHRFEKLHTNIVETARQLDAMTARCAELEMSLVAATRTSEIVAGIGRHAVASWECTVLDAFGFGMRSGLLVCEQLFTAEREQRALRSENMAIRQRLRSAQQELDRTQSALVSLTVASESDRERLSQQNDSTAQQLAAAAEQILQLQHALAKGAAEFQRMADANDATTSALREELKDCEVRREAHSEAARLAREANARLEVATAGLHNAPSMVQNEVKKATGILEADLLQCRQERSALARQLKKFHVPVPETVQTSAVDDPVPVNLADRADRQILESSLQNLKAEMAERLASLAEQRDAALCELSRCNGPIDALPDSQHSLLKLSRADLILALVQTEPGAELLLRASAGHQLPPVSVDAPTTVVPWKTPSDDSGSTRICVPKSVAGYRLIPDDVLTRSTFDPTSCRAGPLGCLATVLLCCASILGASREIADGALAAACASLEDCVRSSHKYVSVANAARAVHCTFLIVRANPALTVEMSVCALVATGLRFAFTDACLALPHPTPPPSVRAVFGENAPARFMQVACARLWCTMHLPYSQAPQVLELTLTQGESHPDPVVATVAFVCSTPYWAPRKLFAKLLAAGLGDHCVDDSASSVALLQTSLQLSLDRLGTLLPAELRDRSLLNASATFIPEHQRTTAAVHAPQSLRDLVNLATQTAQRSFGVQVDVKEEKTSAHDDTGALDTAFSANRQNRPPRLEHPTAAAFLQLQREKRAAQERLRIVEASADPITVETSRRLKIVRRREVGESPPHASTPTPKMPNETRSKTDALPPIRSGPPGQSVVRGPLLTRMPESQVLRRNRAASVAPPSKWSSAFD